MEMSRLTRDGTAEPDSRDQILRRGRGQGNVGANEKGGGTDLTWRWQISSLPIGATGGDKEGGITVHP